VDDLCSRVGLSPLLLKCQPAKLLFLLQRLTVGSLYLTSGDKQRLIAGTKRELARNVVLAAGLSGFIAHKRASGLL